MTSPNTPTSPTEAVELKPCPFCGGVPEAQENVPGTWSMGVAIVCSTPSCGARQSAMSSTEAASRWNTRATPQAPADLVERVASVLAHKFEWTDRDKPDLVYWREIARAALASIPAGGVEEWLRAEDRRVAVERQVMAAVACETGACQKRVFAALKVSRAALNPETSGEAS